MGKTKRVLYILQGILMLLSVGIMITEPEFGYTLIIEILIISFMIYAINQLIYYFTLAKYMVGGKLVLCKALLVLNLAINTWGISDVPKRYIMLYLVGGLALAGTIDVLRALETRKNHGINWRLKLVQGVGTIVISLAGLFAGSTSVIVYFFCAGVVSSAITKFTEAFRKTSIIYIN